MYNNSKNKMEILDQLKSRFQLYEFNKALLSNDELIYYTSHTAPAKLSRELKRFIEDSERAVQQELERNTETLTEAEKERDQALKSKAEAEDREKNLTVLNEKLEKNNRLAGQELMEERKARQAIQNVNFQRVLIYVLGGLIGLSILLSHISSAFAPSDDVLNLTKDAIILLLQIFGMGASYVFGALQKKGRDEK